MMMIVKRLSVFVLLLFLINGCDRDKPNPPPPEDQVKFIDTTEATILGRSFILDVLATTIRTIDYEILQIQGDGILISFHSSSGPFRPSVNGQTIAFGGHTFEVQSNPNEYIVNGQSHPLSAPGIYQFSDGKFISQLR